MTVEPFLRSDLDELASLQPDGWQDIRPAFSLYTQSTHCHPMKMSIDDRLAAVGTAICHHQTAWLGHIIVHHEHRRKGIGLHMTRQLVKFLERTPVETIYLLATDLGAPVYEKAGFSPRQNIFSTGISISIKVRRIHPLYHIILYMKLRSPHWINGYQGRTVFFT